VVDARAGPGLKPSSKAKKIEIAKQEDIVKVRRKHVYIRKKLINRSDSPIIPLDDAADGAISDSSSRSLPQTSLTSTMAKKLRLEKEASFVDLTYWKRKTICCGMIYVGLAGEVMIDERSYTPCSAKIHQEVKPEPSAQTIQSLIEADRESNKGDATATDIDEGFFDKPTTSPEGFKSEEESSHSFKFGLPCS